MQKLVDDMEDEREDHDKIAGAALTPLLIDLTGDSEQEEALDTLVDLTSDIKHENTRSDSEMQADGSLEETQVNEQQDVSEAQRRTHSSDNWMEKVDMNGTERDGQMMSFDNSYTSLASGGFAFAQDLV